VLVEYPWDTRFVKNIAALLLMTLGLSTGLRASEPMEPTTAAASTGAKEGFQVAFGNITIGDKVVATAIQWNTKTGEARLLNAASFADKESGQKGNLIGWVPLVDLQQAVQNLSKQIKSQKQLDTRY
jgi:hypothetical protein